MLDKCESLHLLQILDCLEASIVPYSAIASARRNSLSCRDHSERDPTLSDRATHPTRIIYVACVLFEALEAVSKRLDGDAEIQHGKLRSPIADQGS